MSASSTHSSSVSIASYHVRLVNMQGKGKSKGQSGSRGKEREGTNSVGRVGRKEDLHEQKRSKHIALPLKRARRTHRMLLEDHDVRNEQRGFRVVQAFRDRLQCPMMSERNERERW